MKDIEQPFDRLRAKKSVDTDSVEFRSTHPPHEWGDIERHLTFKSGLIPGYDCPELEQAYMQYIFPRSTQVGAAISMVFFSASILAVFWTVPFVGEFPYTGAWYYHVLTALSTLASGACLYFVCIWNFFNLSDAEQVNWFEIIFFGFATIGRNLIQMADDELRAQCVTVAGDDERMAYRCQSFLLVFVTFQVFPILMNVRCWTLMLTTVVDVFVLTSGRDARTASCSFATFALRSIPLVAHIVTGLFLAFYTDSENRRRFEVHILSQIYAHRASKTKEYVDVTLRALVPSYAVTDLLATRASLHEAETRTVYVWEMCGLSSWVARHGEQEAADFIADLHDGLDQDVASLGLTKYGAVGDRYMCGTPLVQGTGGGHIDPRNVVMLGLLHNERLASFDPEMRLLKRTFNTHAFIHCDTILGAAVGVRRLSYETLGPALVVAHGCLPHVPGRRLGVSNVAGAILKLDEIPDFLEYKGTVRLSQSSVNDLKFSLVNHKLSTDDAHDMITKQNIRLSLKPAVPVQQGGAAMSDSDDDSQPSPKAGSKLDAQEKDQEQLDALRKQIMANHIQHFDDVVNESTMEQLHLDPMPNRLLSYPNVRGGLVFCKERTSSQRFRDDLVERSYWVHAQSAVNRIWVPAGVMATQVWALVFTGVLDWWLNDRGTVQGFALMGVALLMLWIITVRSFMTESPKASRKILGTEDLADEEQRFPVGAADLGSFVAIFVFYGGLLAHGDSVISISVAYLGFTIWPLLAYSGGRRSWVWCAGVLLLVVNVPVTQMISIVGDVDGVHEHFTISLLLFVMRAASQEREQRTIFAEQVFGALEAKQSREQLAAHRALLEMILPAKHIDKAVEVVRTQRPHTERAETAATVAIRLDGFFAAMTDSTADVKARSRLVSSTYAILERAVDSARHLHRMGGSGDTIVFVSLANTVQESIDECLGLLDHLQREFGESLSGITAVGPLVMTISGRGGAIRFNMVGSSIRRACDALEYAPQGFVGVEKSVVNADTRRNTRFGEEEIWETQGDAIVSVFRLVDRQRASALRTKVERGPAAPIKVARRFSLLAQAAAASRGAAYGVATDDNVLFKKGKLLGTGGYGSVFLGTDATSGRVLAAKEVLLDGEKRQVKKSIAILERETAVMQALDHPNIVKYFGTVKEDESFFILMEYVPGGSLHRILRAFGAMQTDAVSWYAKQLLEALCHVHEKGIVHRDIKSGNILIDINGVAKLADFGCSAFGSGRGVVGTTRWIAPEVSREETHGTPADIWSFGCTVMEMLTGKLPFQHVGETFQILTYVYKAMGDVSLPEGLPDDARQFLLECLRWDPSERATAAELLKHPFIVNRNTTDSTGDILSSSPTAGTGSQASGTAVNDANNGSSNDNKIIKDDGPYNNNDNNNTPNTGRESWSAVRSLASHAREDMRREFGPEAHQDVTTILDTLTGKPIDLQDPVSMVDVAWLAANAQQLPTTRSGFEEVPHSGKDGIKNKNPGD